MTWGLAKKYGISQVGAFIWRFSLRISYLAYAQHALNNPKNFKIAPPPKKLCEMPGGPLLKGQERFLKNFMFKSFYGGLNKNEL